MFSFRLKKTQVWVTTALLVMSVSICPHSGYPHLEEDPTVAKEHVEREEDQEPFIDDDEALDEEQAVLEEVTDEENDPKPGYSCLDVEGSCWTLPCCTYRPLLCQNYGGTIGKLCREVKE